MKSSQARRELKAIDDALRARLKEIDALEATIDLSKRDEYLAGDGWNVDAREIALPMESSGPPEPDGAFSAAVEILQDYSFTPQKLITGQFDPSAPLDQRPMLLSARFLWIRLEFGVRINRVVDEIRDSDDGPEQVWGYSYHTLAGHLERGEITFEVVKVLGTGAIFFRIHSFSQTGHISNWLYRIGFRIVGRRLQKRFAEQSLQNMRAQVVARIGPRYSTSRTAPAAR